MYLINFPSGEPVPVPDSEGAIIEAYYRSLNGPSSDSTRRRILLLRIVVGGSTDVGEKAILDRHYYGEFLRTKPVYDPVESEPCGRGCEINNKLCGTRWDFTSLKWYSAALSHAFRVSPASLLIYDVSNRASFSYLTDFYGRVECDLPVFPFAGAKSRRMAIFVVMNKVDLPASAWIVDKTQGQEFAARIGARYLEVSVKDIIGVTEALSLVIAYGLVYCATVEVPGL